MTLDEILQELQRATYPAEQGDTEKTVRKDPRYVSSRNESKQAIREWALSRLPEKLDSIDVGVLTGPKDYKGEAWEPEQAAYLLAHNAAINKMESALQAEEGK